MNHWHSHLYSLYCPTCCLTPSQPAAKPEHTPSFTLFKHKPMDYQANQCILHAEKAIPFRIYLCKNPPLGTKYTSVWMYCSINQLRWTLTVPPLSEHIRKRFYLHLQILGETRWELWFRTSPPGRWPQTAADAPASRSPANRPLSGWGLQNQQLCEAQSKPSWTHRNQVPSPFFQTLLSKRELNKIH